MQSLKKVTIVIFSIIISLECIYIIYTDSKKIRDDVIVDINEQMTKISEYARNVTTIFDKHGKILLTASYKGAHGESNPHDFSYNYSFENNNMYLSNEEGYVKYDMTRFTNILSTLANLKELEYELIISEKKTSNKIVYEIDKYLINQIYNTNFNTISIEVYTTGLITKIKNYQLKIDDYTITKENNKIIMENPSNRVVLSIGSTGYSLNVNEKLKVNVIDYYQYNISLNGTSIFAEITDKGIYLSGLTSHSIYNSIELNLNFESVEVDKNKMANYVQNPINRYFSEVDLNIWKEN